MQYRCIRARQGVAVGDLVEVPDGAAVSDLYYEPVQEPPSPPPAAATPPPAAPAAPASTGGTA